MDRKLLRSIAPDLPGHDALPAADEKVRAAASGQAGESQPAAQNQAQLPTQLHATPAAKLRLPPRARQPSATALHAATESETVIENGVYRIGVYQSRRPRRSRGSSRNTPTTKALRSNSSTPRPPSSMDIVDLVELRRDPAQPSELRPLMWRPAPQRRLQQKSSSPTPTPKSRFRRPQVRCPQLCRRRADLVAVKGTPVTAFPWAAGCSRRMTGPSKQREICV